MVSQEKIRLMTRLAILEKQHGRQIRKAENAFRIDLLTNPVWKMGFFASLLFAAAAAILMALNINMFLDAFASGQLKSLIMVVLIAYSSILLITILIAAVRSYGSYRKSLYYQKQYRSLLEKIRRFDAEGRKGSSRYASGPEASSRYASGPEASRQTSYGYRPPQDEEDDWEDEPSRQRGRGNGNRREDLDYRHMQTLEFEDDEYIYYVEATPKRGGR